LARCAWVGSSLTLESDPTRGPRGLARQRSSVDEHCANARNVLAQIPPSARGLSKTFAGQRVLDNASLALHPGEIHGLIGQNGSGKSTLIKLLAGYHVPDPGAQLSINGDRFVDLPLVASNELIGFVHQDLALVPGLNVADNLALGREYQMSRWRAISWRREHDLARELLAELGRMSTPAAPSSA